MLINRLDSLCTLVLTGHWPAGRRYTSDPQLNPPADDQGDELGYPRTARRGPGAAAGEGPDGQDTEFTVKLLKVRNGAWEEGGSCGSAGRPRCFIVMGLTPRDDECVSVLQVTLDRSASCMSEHKWVVWRDAETPNICILLLCCL